ncbi:hypothetical protein AB0346_16430 [Nocardia beijingensis]
MSGYYSIDVPRTSQGLRQPEESAVEETCLQMFVDGGASLKLGLAGQ